MSPSKDYQAAISEASIDSHDLTILYLKDLPSSEVESVLMSLTHYESIHSPLLKYVAISQIDIKKEHLQPQHGNPLLAALVPPQTYLNIGSETLSFEHDIN